MQNSIFASIIVFILNCALAVTALPSNVNSEPGISPRNVFARKAAGLGINCRGSYFCPSAVRGNIKAIKDAVAGIDGQKKFTSGQKITCVPATINYDGSMKNGLCVFPQKLAAGDTVTVQEVKDAVDDLIAHGCERCGSTPIHSGEITINYVDKPCHNGVCDF